MKPEALKQELNQGLIRPVYLFYGNEPYLIRQYCSQITKLAVPDGSFQEFNLFRTDKMDAEQIAQFLQTPPVFADKKLMILRDTGVFQSPKAADKEQLTKLLSQVSDDACLVFCEQAVDKKQKKLLSLVEPVECNQLSEAQLKNWINILARRQQKKMTVKTIEYLIACCGTSMFHLEHEVNKLCSGVQDQVITPAHIDQMVVKSVENRIFDLSKAVIDKNASAAFSILEDLKTLRESPMKIIGFLSKTFCDIYKIKQCPNPTPQTTGLHPYVVKLHTAAAKKQPQQRLSRLISLAAQCDMALKSSAVPDWVLLEACVASCLEA